jgi:DNA-binding transcriptional ArsR family regulator
MSASSALRTHLDETFAALADPTRRRVVDLLGTRPHRAGEIATTFGMSRPAMSRHLRVLRTCGLVEERRDVQDARARVYQLRPEPISELESWVAEVQGFWTDQLASFKTHAEAKRKR